MSGGVLALPLQRAAYQCRWRGDPVASRDIDLENFLQLSDDLCELAHLQLHKGCLQ